MPGLRNGAPTGSGQSQGPGGGAPGWRGWRSSPAGERPSDPSRPGREGAGFSLKTGTSRQRSSPTGVSSGTSGSARASHGGCPRPAVRAAASSPAAPPADISASSRPVSTSLFPASSSSPRRWAACQRAPGELIHSNNGGVFYRAAGDANAARGAGWGLRNAVRPGESSRAASRARHSRPDPRRKGLRPRVATGSRTDPRALAPADARLWPAPPR